MSTIVVTEEIDGPYDDLAAPHRLVRDGAAWRTPARLHELLGDAEVAIVRNRTLVDQAFFDAAPSLRIVARAGAGLDNIDLEAADRAGVVVIAPIGANAVSVGEHALALALALSKRLLPAHGSTAAGGWDRTPTQELKGKTWGLLSAGATARATARLARAIGMTIVAFDPYVAPDHQELRELGVELAPLEEVLSRADVLSVHLPYTEATHHILNERTLGLLPRGALVISVGRGEVVDEEALVAALESGQVGGAGLDVRGSEPPQPGALERHPNVILTPHIAGVTEQAQERIAEILLREISAVLGGGETRFAVGSHAGLAQRSVL
jgi:phosphoglycerate dehydrogenase-like enzyme